MLCGTISVTCRTVGLIRATGLKGFGTFTGLGVCSRFRWASVVGRALMRAMPVSGGRVAVRTPSRMATYSEKVRIGIPVSTATGFKKKKKQAVTISTGRADGTKFQRIFVSIDEFSTLQYDRGRSRGRYKARP